MVTGQSSDRYWRGLGHGGSDSQTVRGGRRKVVLTDILKKRARPWRTRLAAPHASTDSTSPARRIGMPLSRRPVRLRAGRHPDQQCRGKRQSSGRSEHGDLGRADERECAGCLPWHARRDPENAGSRWRLNRQYFIDLGPHRPEIRSYGL